MDADIRLATLLQISGENDTNVLSTYLHFASEIILNRIHGSGMREDLGEQYYMTQVRIAEYLLSKRGAEGELSHSENGVSRSYESGDVPMSLLRDVIPRGKVL